MIISHVAAILIRHILISLSRTVWISMLNTMSGEHYHVSNI